MLPALVEVLFPNNKPAHIITYENEFCQRARYIDLRQVVNPSQELFQFWITELPDDPQFPFQHGLELHGDVANVTRLKGQHKKQRSCHLTIEVDYLAYQEKYNGKKISWEPEHATWIKQAQRNAMLASANASGMPYAVAVDSGNKSVHFICVLRHTEEEMAEFQDPRSKTHYIYLYAQFLLKLALGDYDNGVFKQAGYKLTRAPLGIRRDKNNQPICVQDILQVNQTWTTFQEIIQWGEAQLSPDALTNIRLSGIYSYKLACKSPYALLTDPYFKDLVLGSDFYNDGSPLTVRTCAQGGRGEEWRKVAKKIMLAGSRAPYQQTPMSNDILAPYNASFLWYFSFYIFNSLCEVPFHTEIADALRWEKEAEQEIRHDPQTFGHATDTDLADIELLRMFQANSAGEDPIELANAEKKIIAEEKKRHREVAAVNPNFQSNIAGINSAMSAMAAGSNSSDDMHYGIEADNTIRTLLDNLIYLKYVVDNDEARRESWWLYCNKKHIWEPLHKYAAEKIISDARPDLASMSPYKFNQLTLAVRAKLLHNESWAEYQWATVFRNGTLYFTRNPNPLNLNDMVVFREGEWNPNENMQVFHDFKFDSRILTDPNYDWSRIAPHFAEFLRGLFESPEDDLRITQEFLGQALWPLRQHQRLLIFRGSGGDGKGVLMQIIMASQGGRVYNSEYRPDYSTKAIRGHAETFAVDKLAEKHAGSMFVGQRLLIDEEIKVLTKHDDIKQTTSIIKKITGEGEIMREDKGKQISKEKTEARLILCCNNEPQFSDTNKGIWRRLAIVRCRSIPRGRVEIDRFHEKFTDSDTLSAVYNYRLIGLFMYMRNRAEGRPGLTMTPVLLQRVQDLRNDADPISTFFDMHMEPSQIAFPNEVNYKQYSTFPISIDILLKMINQLGFENNEKHIIKRKDLENALSDNDDLAGAARLHEFARRDSAIKHNTIGVPTRTARIGVLLGYTCTYPAMQEMAGEMFHEQHRNPNIQGDFKRATGQGGL